MAKKKIKIKHRNPYAVSAWVRPGAGLHTDKKKQESKLKCRKKVTEE